MITKEEVQNQNKLWENARKAVRLAIVNNQKAMSEFRNEKNEANEKAYKATRELHKQTIANIKQVRNKFYQMKYEFETQNQD